MISYLVIGICIFLLLAVIYISAKPISMGIEARRSISDNIKSDDIEIENIENSESNNTDTLKISEEIVKLNQLRKDGVITEEEYIKAKEKLLN